MARKKSTESIDSEISKIKSDMARLQDRYDKLSEKLKVLQEQKWQQEAATIMDMDAYRRSGKSLDEIMTFLEP